MKCARMLMLVGAVAGAALLLPMTAAAALPTPTKALIVPFKSFGPIQFGTTKAKAVEKWGTPQCAHEDTTGQDTCAWFPSHTQDYPPEGGLLQIANGKVCGMAIQAGVPFPGDGLTITRFEKWDTEEGVGLGSKMRAAKHVLGGTTVKEKNHITTVFTSGFTDSTTNKVQRIEIYKDGCHVT